MAVPKADKYLDTFVYIFFIEIRNEQQQSYVATYNKTNKQKKINKTENQKAKKHHEKQTKLLPNLRHVCF